MKIMFCLLIALGLGGCVSTSPSIDLDYGTFSSVKYPPKNEQQEIVLLTSASSRTYKEIGIIKVTAKSKTSLEDINQALLSKAREVGADAVINLQYSEVNASGTYSNGPNGETRLLTKKNAQGIAVIFTDNK